MTAAHLRAPCKCRFIYYKSHRDIDHSYWSQLQSFLERQNEQTCRKPWSSNQHSTFNVQYSTLFNLEMFTDHKVLSSETDLAKRQTC